MQEDFDATYKHARKADVSLCCVLRDIPYRVKLSAVVLLQAQQRRDFVAKMRHQGGCEVVDFRFCFGPTVRLGCCALSVVLKVCQACEERVVLVLVLSHDIRVVCELLELWEQRLLFCSMVVLHSLDPCQAVEQEVRHVLRVRHKRSLLVDAVETADQDIVSVGHLRSAVNSCM
jgi:hypothetical protein